MQIASQVWLSRIDTNWTLVGRAHANGSQLATSARNHLMDKYCGAALRYLLAATRDQAIAEDIFQEFALRLIRGDFRRAEPTKGRFRDYVKTVLINLIKDHYRDQDNKATSLPAHLAAPASSDSQQYEFDKSWRDELLDRTWAALDQQHPMLFAVLQSHVQDVTATASEKADRLGDQIGESITANRFRVMLHRAREKFSGLLQQEVADSLPSTDVLAIQRELQQLRLSRYCKPVAQGS